MTSPSLDRDEKVGALTFIADANAVRCDAQGTEAGAMARSRIAYLPDTLDRGFMRVGAVRIFRRT
jgi:hypothetical protein